MSMLTQVFILEKYGVRLNIEQLAELMGYAVNTLYNKLSQGKLGVKTYVADGKRWCDYRDAAVYFDRCRADAKTQV